MHDDQAAHLFSNLSRELECFVASLPIGLIWEIQTYKIGIMILMPRKIDGFLWMSKMYLIVNLNWNSCQGYMPVSILHM